MDVLDIEVTDADLAALASVTSRRIRQLATEGKLVRIARNRFKLGPAVQVLLAEAAENNEGSELQKERLLKLRAERVMAELELAKQKARLHPLADIQRVWTARAALIRSNILNVTNRAVLQLLNEGDEATFKRKLREELVSALQAAANAEIVLSEDDEEPEGGADAAP